MAIRQLLLRMLGIQRIKEAAKLITTFLKQVAKRWLKFRLNDKIDRLNNKSSLRYTKIDLEQIFDSLFNIYISTLSDKGLFGAWKERKAILEQIRSLNFGMFDKSSKYILEPDFNESLIHLAMFKNILINIKYTVEGLLLIKTIFSLISKISFLPIFILSIWILFRRIYIWFSLLFTSSLVSIYLTNQFDYISKTADYLIAIKLILSELSIRAHNWLFNDDLVSRREVERAIDSYMSSNHTRPYGIDGIMIKSGDYFNSSYKYLSSVSQYIDWNIAGYASVGLLTIITSYLVYTGTITPIPTIKKVGSILWSILSYFWFEPDDGGTSSGGAGGGIPTSGSSGVVSISDEAKEAWIGSVSSNKGKGRLLDTVVIERPSAISVGTSKQIDLPLDSAGISWRLPNLFRLRESQGSSTDVEPLIEVTPSSPTGSVDSNRTIKAVEGGPGYPNIVIYPPTSNNNNEPPFLTTELIPNGLVVSSTLGSTYPDPNLGVWEPIYLKDSCGVATPESYEHLTALNQRFPNLTPLQLEEVCDKIKTGDNSIFKTYAALGAIPLRSGRQGGG